MTDVRERIDSYPTHRIEGYATRVGKPFPFGATLVPGGVTFSVYAGDATAVSLVIFRKGARSPMAELPYPPEFRIGSVYTMTVFGLDCENIDYGFRVEGPMDPARGDRYDGTKILSDPYAKVLSGRDVWGAEPDYDDVYQHRSRLLFEDFDWEDDRQLEIPIQDLVIYETHVRGFTASPTSGTTAPGTYAALQEKIPYLKSLGVNCVELMPIFEFDEFENSRTNPDTGERLYNYWGYSTVGFFAPKAGFAATGHLGMQADELKNLVKQLHAAGIEVMLDVVFNHTAEGNEQGPTISFRGLDNKTYYMLTSRGEYYNFSGTGNTLNCNNPIVRGFVLDCLRYWVAEYHIDGFRFDLAAILDRDPSGAPLANPPLLESLAADPVLKQCKLIAEAWDAGGLYEVGTFPAYCRWAEWNGKYRDTVRRFLKGDVGLAGEFATRIAGSGDLYGARGAAASINFVTAHDGFTLADLVAYNDKHNEANGEGNRDGGDDNNSWNCGAEGPTDDPEILDLRRRQAKNALTILLTSHGVPMLLGGDEAGRTQQGNNNGYCHDSELTWFDWGLVDDNCELVDFTRRLIAFRNAHPALRTPDHAGGEELWDSGYPAISWHGRQAWQPDWSPSTRLVAALHCGPRVRGEQVVDDYVYVAVNADWEACEVQLPGLPDGVAWHVAVNTSAPAPADAFDPGSEPLLEEQHAFLIGPRSAVVLTGRQSPAREA